MPVLSEQIAEVEPSVSVERRRFTIAFARASICVPSERIVVTTAGRPVGIAEMANAIAAVKTSSKLSPRERLRIIEIATAMPAIRRICRVSAVSWRVSGVSVSSCSWRRPEMWPTSVAIPVAVTTNCPVPRVVFVFMKTMSVRSPSGTSSPATGSTLFATGRLSPVSAASATSSVAAASSRPSAGTMSPASIETMSPGTSCSAGITTSAPSRRTFALMIIIFCSAATAAAALPSWRRPRTAFSSVRRSRTRPVAYCSSGTMLPMPATSRTICIGSRYWRDEGAPAGLGRGFGEPVGAVALEAGRGLRRGQPLCGVDLERRSDLVATGACTTGAPPQASGPRPPGHR